MADEIKRDSLQSLRTSVLKSVCELEHIQGNVYSINSLPIAPFKGMTVDCVPSQNDRQILTIKFPNYDFSNNVYPIISIIKTMVYNDQKNKWEFCPPDESGIVIEGLSDSIVVDFPLYFNDSSVFIDLSQNRYVNNTFYSPYMGVLNFSDLYYFDETKKDVTITLPNVSASTFNSWDLENILIIIEDNHINLFGTDHIKISDEIIESDQERYNLYYNYWKALQQNH